MYGGLNELRCKALLKTPGKYGDGNNLWFVVGPNQRAKWGAAQRLDHLAPTHNRCLCAGLSVVASCHQQTGKSGPN